MTRFMVQWADHPSHLATRLGQLLEHQTLVDVTLMCNTHTLRVHRAVLAAGSPYFETILQRQLGQHPLIVLKDMQFTVLKCLIEFMYCGETSVTEDNLPALLQAAKFFQVRGLSAMTKEALGLKSGPADLAINGAGDASTAPSVQTSQVALPRPGTKRVNVEGKPTPNKQRAVLKSRAIPAEAQSSPKPRATGDVPRMTFHTIPKTVPTRPLSSRSTETQADNARLLLSLSGSESFQTKTVTSAPPATVLGRPRQIHTPLSTARNVSKPAASSAGNKNIRFHHNVSGIIPPIGTKLTLHDGVNRVVTTPKRRGRPPARSSIPKTLTPALKLALENQAKNKAIAPKPAPEPTLPMEFVAVEKEEMGINAHGEEKTPTLYRDPNTNILYQVDDTPTASAETETIIYQLPDGTITDKDGNAIVDEDGNTQNINNYQMERGAGGDVVYQMEGTSGEEDGNVVYQMEGGTEEETAGTVEGGESLTVEGGESLTHSEYMDVLKRAGLPTDMPILLDSGDGNYVAVNEEVLRNIVDGGVLQCQVTEGNLVREDGEEFLVQPEEPATESQEQVEEPMQLEQEQQEEQQEEEAMEHLVQVDEEEVCQPPQEQEEEGEDNCGEAVGEEEEMTIVGKSLPSLDDEEGEEEVITGDPYGELSFHSGETSDHNFSSQEETNAIVEETTSVEHAEFVYEEKESVDESAIKPAISVEQALEEMMGEDTEGAVEKEGEGETEQLELDNLQSVLNSSMESSAPNAFQNETALAPGDDSSATNPTGEDSIEGDECALKTSSLLKNALRESGIVAEGGEEDSLKEDDSMESLEGGQALKEVVYEITNEDGEKRRITISGEAILLPGEGGGEEGKVGVSPSKDIPYAVGLLPLQTALEKIQSMPDYQPRKTRSSDEPAGNNAPARNKRRASANASSDAGAEKRVKLDGVDEEGDVEGGEEKGNDMESLIPELVEANEN